MGANSEETAAQAGTVSAAAEQVSQSVQTVAAAVEEMGASIRVITHYFADKDTLLLWVYRMMAEQGQQHLSEVLARSPNDLAAIDAANVNYPARHISCAGGLRQKQKQAELRGKPPHQALAMTGEVAECDLSTVNAARGRRTVKREPSPSLLCTSTVP